MNYLIAAIDLSYILRRNSFASFRDKTINELNSGDIIRMTIQTLNKLRRDYNIKVDKFVFFADKWSEAYGGYYRHYLLGGNYKTSRTWMTQEKLTEIKNDPNSTKEKIEKAELELKQNEVTQEAKEILKTELRRFGIPCMFQEGWEFDDIAYLFACIWSTYNDPRKCLIITKDSDLQYSINPKVDYFRLPTGGSKPEIITYEQMYNNMPQSIKDRGVSLYQYKALLDSIGETHNDLKKTRKPRTKPLEVIEKILDNDFSLLSDPELFKLQFSTFDIANFPCLQELSHRLRTELFTIGHLGSIEEFRTFCKNRHVTGISDYYYSEFIGNLNQKLYSE